MDQFPEPHSRRALGLILFCLEPVLSGLLLLANTRPSTEYSWRLRPGLTSHPCPAPVPPWRGPKGHVRAELQHFVSGETKIIYAPGCRAKDAT